MSLEAVIQENTDTMKALIAALTATAIASTSAAAAPKPAKPAASGPATAKVVEAAAPESTTSAPAPAAASAVADAQASTAATEPVTYDQVSKAITDGVKANRDHVVATLAKFGAKKGTELKVEQYVAFLAALA